MRYASRIILYNIIFYLILYRTHALTLFYEENTIDVRMLASNINLSLIPYLFYLITNIYEFIYKFAKIEIFCQRFSQHHCRIILDLIP